MAYSLNALSTKENDLSSVPKIHMMEGEKQLPQVILWSLRL